MRRIRLQGQFFLDGKPRFIKIQGNNVDADIGNSTIYIVNEDVPGIVGFVGNVLGKAGINIAHFHFGRSKLKEDAVFLLCVDGCVSSDILEELSSHAAICSIKQLEFNVERFFINRMHVKSFTMRWCKVEVGEI